MDKPLTIAERILARHEQRQRQGMSLCFRCQRPWGAVKGHCTNYAPGSSCFPLCENCWAMLTPEERLPYFKAAWIKYWHTHPWEVYRAACLYERQPMQVDSIVEGFRLIGARPGYWRGEVTSSVVPGTRTTAYYITPRLPPELVAAWLEYDVTIAEEFAATE